MCCTWWPRDCTGWPLLKTESYIQFSPLHTTNVSLHWWHQAWSLNNKSIQLLSGVRIIGDFTCGVRVQWRKDDLNNSASYPLVTVSFTASQQLSVTTVTRVRHERHATDMWQTHTTLTEWQQLLLTQPWCSSSTDCRPTRHGWRHGRPSSSQAVIVVLRSLLLLLYCDWDTERTSERRRRTREADCTGSVECTLLCTRHVLGPRVRMRRTNIARHAARIIRTVSSGWDNYSCWLPLRVHGTRCWVYTTRQPACYSRRLSTGFSKVSSVLCECFISWDMSGLLLSRMSYCNVRNYNTHYIKRKRKTITKTKNLN